jgi:carotenoid 1,2-hydratase
MTPFGFDRPVADGGYAWWYADVVSDDGAHALTVIAFIGSVFSPYYRRARRTGRAPALAHCALNVALYAAGGRHWAMTERGAGAVTCSADRFGIGPSHLLWDGSVLQIAVDEFTAPWRTRLRGTIVLRPSALHDAEHALDAAGRHRWRPIAPCARADVVFDAPALAFSGPAYLDANRGDEPLETAFRRWDWSRAALAGGAVAVLYDAERRDGSHAALALRFSLQGDAGSFEAPPRVALPTSAWRMRRATRSSAPARVVRTLEDSPFYVRSLTQQTLLGERCLAVHESLDLDRFSRPWLQAMLPVRMPR